MNRYFFMEQDNALMDVIGLRNFDIYGKRHIFTWKDAAKINDVTPLYLDETKGECAPDFIKSPVYMVSEKAKKVIDMYEDELVFKKIVLIHKEEGRELIYFHLLLKEIEAVDDAAEYYPNGMEKRVWRVLGSAYLKSYRSSGTRKRKMSMWSRERKR